MTNNIPNDLPSNSQSKKISKNTDRVVRGEVVKRKIPLSRRIAQTMTGDNVGSVGEYMVMDVLVPAFKDTISDLVSGGIERLLFGTNANRGRSSGGRSTGYVSYDKARSNGGRDSGRELSKQARGNHQFEDVLIDNRGEAEEVLERLVDLIDQFGEATVADFYNLVGISGTFVDDNWGWIDLRGSRVSRAGGSYRLDLPRPIAVN